MLTRIGYAAAIANDLDRDEQARLQVCWAHHDCIAWIAVVLPQRVAGPTTVHFVEKRPTSALGGDRRFRH
jgi:hypothetical protein